MNDINLKELILIGEGSHGKVYRLDDKRCIKVCRTVKHMLNEYSVLKHAEQFPHFPRVYECKDNYMIREYIDGINIIDFIQKNGFDQDLAKKLIEIIDVFSKLGFTRLDCRFSQLFVTGDKQIKIIDTTRHMDKIANYPYKMLKGLRRLGYKEEFLKYVQEFRPNYYEAWKDK